LNRTICFDVNNISNSARGLGLNCSSWKESAAPVGSEVCAQIDHALLLEIAREGILQECQHCNVS